MPHHDNLILILVAGFVLAFAFGMAAVRLKLSPLVGYLLAGVVVGPFTPGYVADASLAPQLAEIGVILLMFGVGLHFSVRDLLAARKVALPGALGQIVLATALGWGLGRLLGLPHTEALLLGFSLSVASTVVVLRALEERGKVRSEAGRIAVSWLIVEDLVIIVALVLLPLLATAQSDGLDWPTLGRDIAWTLLKVAVFVGLMLVVGGRVLPWLLVRIAHTRSPELFTLGVLAIALGIAYLAYTVFGASFALGAFIAGVVLNGTELGGAAAQRSLPLRDAFAVLFFVSVGMLFDPAVLIREPLAIAAVLAVIMVGAALPALVLGALFRLPRRTTLVIAAALAQIGEFSFLLAGIGVNYGLITDHTQDLILAAALLSIVLNPFLFRAVDLVAKPVAPAPSPPNPAPASAEAGTTAP